MVTASGDAQGHNRQTFWTWARAYPKQLCVFPATVGVFEMPAAGNNSVIVGPRCYNPKIADMRPSAYIYTHHKFGGCAKGPPILDLGVVGALAVGLVFSKPVPCEARIVRITVEVPLRVYRG